MAPLIDLLICV